MTKYILSAVLVSFTILLCQGGEENGFRTNISPELSVYWNSEIFIKSDSFSSAAFDKCKIGKELLSSWETIFNVYGEYPEFRFFKEVACRKDEVELNLWCRAEPKEPGPKGFTTYTFTIPVFFLRGCRYRAVSHMPYAAAPHFTEGIFSGEEKSDFRLFKPGLYLEIFKGKQKIAIDLQPCGSTEEQGYGNGSRNYWYMYRDGENYKLVNGVQYWRIGGSDHFKVILRSGDNTDYYDIHPFYVSSEYFPYKIVHGFDFGGKKDKGAASFMEPCGLDEFDSKKGFGWLGNGDKNLLLVYENESNSPRGTAIEGNGESVFRLDARAGLYLLNVQSGSFKKDLKGFNISINEKTSVFPSTMRGEFLLKTIPVFVKENGLDVKFQGPAWRLTALSLQAVILTYEDFMISRSWYLVPASVPPCAKFENLEESGK